MTEDEAKTKYCHNAGNQTRCANQDGRCIGSECMAWVWTGVATESIQTSGPDYAHYAVPEGEGWVHTFSDEKGQLITGSQGEGGPYYQVWTRPRPDGTRTGGCGLVKQGGKP